MRHTLRSVLTSLVLAGVVAACSADAPSASDSADAQATSDSETIKVPEAKVSFELPSAWLELDPDEATDSVGNEALMAELQKRYGPDTKSLGPVYWFIADASMLDSPNQILVAAVPGVENGALTRVRVTVRDDEELPTIEKLEEDYNRGAAYPLAYIDVAEIDTEVGPAILTGRSMEIPDPPAWHWADAYVDTGAEVLTFTVITEDRDKSLRIASEFADSLQPLS